MGLRGWKTTGLGTGTFWRPQPLSVVGGGLTVPLPPFFPLLLSSLTPPNHHCHRHGLGVRVLTLGEGASLTGWKWMPVCCESCDNVMHGAAGMHGRRGTAQAARVSLHP